MADSGGGALVRPVEFREVDEPRFLDTASPQFTRGPNFVAWSEATTGGIFATGPQTLADLRIGQGFCRRLLANGPPRALLIDARDFGVDAVSLDSLLHASPLQGARDVSNIVRISVLLPLGWSRAFWMGAIALGVGGPSARGFTDPESAWCWLGASEATRLSVERLRIVTSPSKLEADLHAQLRTNPTLSIGEAARALKSSPRSLQRALKDAGITFAEARSRARVELAAALLRETDEKLDAIAVKAGFRSRSYFASWFRQVVGQSPDQFRRSHPTPRS
jgi:AraC-like DNA-binding protein